MKHSLFSPSRLELRALCPASYKLEKEHNPQDVETKEGNIGKEKHNILERYFKKEITKEKIPFQDIVWCIDYIEQNGLLDNAIETFPECQIDLTSLGIETLDGNKADLVIIKDDRIILVDYKFTHYFVSADSLQIKAYSYGINKKYGLPVYAYVIMPALQKISQYSFLTPEMFINIEKEIKNIITNCQNPEAPFVRGSHCDKYFCKCKDICPQWQNYLVPKNLNTEIDIINYFCSLSESLRGDFVDELKFTIDKLEKLYNTISDYAISHNLKIDGYKVVSGKKTKYFADMEKAITQLKILAKENNIPENKVVEPISVSKATKLFGEQILENMKDIIHERISKPYLLNVNKGE